MLSDTVTHPQAIDLHGKVALVESARMTLCDNVYDTRRERQLHVAHRDGACSARIGYRAQESLAGRRGVPQDADSAMVTTVGARTRLVFPAGVEGPKDRRPRGVRQPDFLKHEIGNYLRKLGCLMCDGEEAVTPAVHISVEWSRTAWLGHPHNVAESRIGRIKRGGGNSSTCADLAHQTPRSTCCGRAHREQQPSGVAAIRAPYTECGTVTELCWSDLPSTRPAKMY